MSTALNTFRVQCETCQSWLKVRDEGFVGEVHACPKCGSMVLIAPGTGSAGTEPAAAEEAPVVAMLSQTLESAEPPEWVEPSATPEPSEPPVEPAPVAAAAESVAPVAAVAWKPWLMVAGVAVACGAVLTVWFTSGPPAPVAVVAVETPEPPTPAKEAEPPADNAPAPTEAPAPLDAETEPALPPAEAAPEEDPTPRVALATPPAVDPPPAVAPVAEPAPVEPEPSTPPAVIDPLSFDPNEVELVLRHGPAEEPSLGESPPDSMADGPAPPGEPTLDDRLAAVAEHADVFVRPGPSDATTLPTTTPAELALAYVLPEIDLREAPLDEATRLLGKIAGTPITIDPAALGLAGVEASKPMDLAAEGQTLGELLDALLGKARLGYVAEGPHVRVVRRGADGVRTITHQVGDLAAGDPAAFAELLARLTPLASPADLGADGGLTLTAPLATHYGLVVLCERLRVARGLPQDTKYPRRLLDIEPSLATLAPRLDRRATFSFVEPTALEEVFAYWRRVTGLSILVDWRSLADVGLGPRTRVQCSATNRPWRVALDGVLASLGLTWAPADGRTLWITTPDADGLVTVEFYPAPPAAVDGLPRGVVAEAFGDRLIVRAPAVLQRGVAERIGVNTPGHSE